MNTITHDEAMKSLDELRDPDPQFSRPQEQVLWEYIAQQRARDGVRADTVTLPREVVENVREALKNISDAPACGPGGSLYYEVSNEDGQTDAMHVDPLGWIGDASTKARTALAALERGEP